MRRLTKRDEYYAKRRTKGIGKPDEILKGSFLMTMRSPGTLPVQNTSNGCIFVTLVTPVSARLFLCTSTCRLTLSVASARSLLCLLRWLLPVLLARSSGLVQDVSISSRQVANIVVAMPSW